MNAKGLMGPSPRDGTMLSPWHPSQALKQPAAQFAATRDTAATIAEATPAAQADWLWESYAAHSGASPQERGSFGGALIT